MQRTVHATVPVKVVTVVTPDGERLKPVVSVMMEFGLWLKARAAGSRRSLDRVAFILSMHLRGSTKSTSTMITNRPSFSLLIALPRAARVSPNAPQAKPPGFGPGGLPCSRWFRGGRNWEYCFHYSKRLWELTSLLRENQITPQKARDVTKASLGSQVIAGRLAGLGPVLLRVDHAGGTGLANASCDAPRYLHLPVEARHHAISQSCFGVLKVPRHVYGLSEQGKTIDQARVTLLAANSLSTGKILGSIIDDVKIRASSGVDQFNGLSRRMFFPALRRAVVRTLPSNGDRQ